ncbi:MAG: thioredoxin family protein [Actinobacteria bacterium]|nr:MAG: thioredoxin family protein [Actinomycetota bacterium]
MKVKLFYKEACPRCPAAKELVKETKDVKYFDIEEVDGLSEATYYGVMSTPSIIVVDDSNNLIKTWLGEVPTEEEYNKWL